jgi:hypothetical protein
MTSVDFVQDPFTAMNKNFIIVFSLFVTVSVQAGDPAVEEKVKAIRAQYSEIEGSLKDCKEAKRDLPGESAEGGELTAYVKDSSVRKLSAKFFGETGKALQEYYFWDNQLIFVLRVESHYTKPMSGVVKNKTEERFYFANGSLIRWLDAQKKDVTASAEKSARERDLLADAKKYSARIEDGR